MQCRILFHNRELRHFDWCLLDQNDQQSPQCGSDDIDQLADICAKSSQVIVFLPQQDILLAMPQLPPRANKQQLAAIAYALEETLAQDIEDCFFALLPQQTDQTVPVAVIEREIMDDATALLNRLHIPARYILPAICLCPWSEADDWLASVCKFNDTLLIRYGRHQGMACASSISTHILSQIAKTSETPRSQVDLYGIDLYGIEPADEIEGLSFHPHSAIKILAQPLDLTSCINFKQKEYLSSNQWSGIFKRWKWPAVALLLVGLVLLASNVIDSWQQQQQLKTLIGQQQHLMQEYLPHLPVSEHPKNQLIKFLSQNSSAGGKAGFIDLLYEFSRLKTGFKQLRINRIVYQQSQLVVSLETADLNSMEAFRTKLEASNYPGKIENVNINPDKTTGRLVMKGVQ